MLSEKLMAVGDWNTPMLAAVVSLLSILASSLVFINAVETLGEKLGLTRFAIGSVLIAFLTALPETSIALVSPWRGSIGAFEVGEAAVIGAPSITILIGVPLILYLSRGETSRTNLSKPLRFNYNVFAILFPIVALIGFAASRLRTVAAILLLAGGLYLAYLNVRMKGELFEAGEKLYFLRAIPAERIALPLQLGVGLAGMLYSADVFIDSLSAFSNPFFYSVVLSPIGTCLQEVIAAGVLAMKGKGDVGLAVLAGENMIQATIVSGVGMIATPWTLAFAALPVALTFSLIAISYSLKPRTMRFLGIPAYVVYVAAAWRFG